MREHIKSWKCITQTDDKKEDILIIILYLAESIRETHPELESNLKSVDGTITLHFINVVCVLNMY